MKLQRVTEADVQAAAAAHSSWLQDCIIRLLCVLALDRFGDFVSDQASTVLPVNLVTT